MISNEERLVDMAPGNMPESKKAEREQRLEREQKWLQITVNVGRPVEFLSKLNARRKRTRAIPVLPPVVPLRSS